MFETELTVRERHVQNLLYLNIYKYVYRYNIYLFGARGI